MKYSLHLGINSYGGGSDLQGCVNDAADWSAALQRRGYQTEVLLDDAATLARIRERMRAVVTEAKYRDEVVITFSGHGTWAPDQNGDEPDGRDEALCPVDVRTAGVLGDDELYDIFTSRDRGVRLVFVSDSCHSGSVNRFASFGGETDEKVRFLPPADYAEEQQLEAARRVAARPLRTLPLRGSALLLAGCRDYEYSYDARIDGRFNGAFSYAALKAMDRLSGTATWRDLMREVRTWLPSQRYPQTPVISGYTSQQTWPIGQRESERA